MLFGDGVNGNRAALVETWQCMHGICGAYACRAWWRWQLGWWELSAGPTALNASLFLFGFDALFVGGLIVVRSGTAIFAVGGTVAIICIGARIGLLSGKVLSRGLATLFALAHILAGQSELDAVCAGSFAIALGS